MAEKFADLPGALQNAAEIAKRCNFEFKLDITLLPQLKLARGKHPPTPCGAKPKKDWKKSSPATPAPPPAPKSIASASPTNLVIIEMGFADYFLIVSEFVNWAKKEGVPVGPDAAPASGRGRLRAGHHRAGPHSARAHL